MLHLCVMRTLMRSKEVHMPDITNTFHGIINLYGTILVVVAALIFTVAVAISTFGDAKQRKL